MVHLWTEGLCGPSWSTVLGVALASGDGLALNQPKVEVLLSTIHPPPWCCLSGVGLVIAKDPDVGGSVAGGGGRRTIIISSCKLPQEKPKCICEWEKERKLGSDEHLFARSLPPA